MMTASEESRQIGSGDTVTLWGCWRPNQQHCSQFVTNELIGPMIILEYMLEIEKLDVKIRDSTKRISMLHAYSLLQIFPSTTNRRIVLPKTIMTHSTIWVCFFSLSMSLTHCPFSLIHTSIRPCTSTFARLKHVLESNQNNSTISSQARQNTIRILIFDKTYPFP